MGPFDPCLRIKNNDMGDFGYRGVDGLEGSDESVICDGVCTSTERSVSIEIVLSPWLNLEGRGHK